MGSSPLPSRPEFLPGLQFQLHEVPLPAVVIILFQGYEEAVHVRTDKAKDSGI